MLQNTHWSNISQWKSGTQRSAMHTQHWSDREQRQAASQPLPFRLTKFESESSLWRRARVSHAAFAEWKISFPFTFEVIASESSKMNTLWHAPRRSFCCASLHIPNKNGRTDTVEAYIISPSKSSILSPRIFSKLFVARIFFSLFIFLPFGFCCVLLLVCVCVDLKSVWRIEKKFYQFS